MKNHTPVPDLSPSKGQFEKTVAVQLHGGMGNQMFQAAAGMALAARMDARLVFDLSRFRHGGLRNYALARFGLDAEVRPRETSLKARSLRLINRLKGVKIRPAWWKGAIFREQSFRYDARFAAINTDVLLAGYYQSPFYFAGQEARIRAAFNPALLATQTGIDLSRNLAGEESAALHIRRGDYAKDAQANAVHGVLGWDYYDRAVAYLRARAPKARLFILSDDPAAAQEAASRWPNAEAIAGGNAGDDFFLLSSARHHILANSTFAWWSAYLDHREGGITIFPKNWFSNQEAEKTDDMMPKHWICL